MSALSLTLIQTRLAWEDKAANLAHFEAMLGELAATDLVLLPELFSTGFSMNSHDLAESMSGSTVAWLQAQASRLGAAICASVIIQQDGEYYNRLIWVESDGGLYRYDKRHLFRMAGEHAHYSAGSERLVVEINGFSVCPMVCYDLRFPVWSRNREDYDLLLFIANWPAARSLHWQTLLRARAVENLCFVAGLNRIGPDGKGIDHSGDSVVLNYRGEAMVEMHQQDGSVTVTLEKESLKRYRSDFPAYLDADTFSIDT